jgi:hypothetical protein
MIEGSAREEAHRRRSPMTALARTSGRGVIGVVGEVCRTNVELMEVEARVDPV